MRLSSYARRLNNTFKTHIEHRYPGFSIQLPVDHLLPVYQQNHKQYDRFLPHLSKYLGKGATVVDVGANCGDTLAAMYNANPLLKYVCIEPDEVFFGYLQRNMDRIKAIDAQAKISAVKSLVGMNVGNVSLEGHGGTKHAVPGSAASGLSARALDEILADAEISELSLLKSDVDGFDYDVIDSARLSLKTHHPLVYFECQVDQASQKSGYEATIASLASNGYRDWVVFDNYGDVLLRTRDIQYIFQLIEYVWRQNEGHTTRTVHYYDILGACEHDTALITTVVDDYLASCRADRP